MSELISDVEALTALRNGEDVEYLEDDNKWNLIDKEFVVISALLDCKLRLKTRTITINGIEVPAPFEPKEDCNVYILNDKKTVGYQEYFYEIDGDGGNVFFGVWRTEDEIKQVVSALRSVFNAR